MTTIKIGQLSAALVFIFISLECCSLGISQKDHIFRSTPSTLENNTEFSDSQRAISAEDIWMIINAIKNNNDKSVMFLFGQDYDDLMIEITKFLSEEVIDFMYLRNNGDMNTLSKSFSSIKENNIMLLVDLPTNIVNLFQTMRKKRVKTHLAKWILLLEGSDALHSIAKLEEMVSEGTKVIIFIKLSEEHLDLYLPSVDIQGVTRFRKGGKEESRRYFENTIYIEPEKEYSLSGRQFKVAIKDSMMLVKSGRSLPDGSVELVSGIDVHFLNILASVLNFTYKAFPSIDGTHGDLTQDGNVTGIIGMVARREASFAMAGLSITETRASVVDFTSQYGNGRYLLMSLAPKEKDNLLAVLSPFKLQVWIFLAVAVLLMGYFVFLILFFTLKYQSAEVETGVLWVIFNMFRNVVNQGNVIKDNSPQVRAVLSMWFFFCIIVSALYCGKLTAVLAIPAYDTPIDSLHDLPRAVKEGYSVGTIGGSAYELFFKYATEGVLKQTWDLFNHEDRSKSFVDSVLDGVHLVLKGKFVFITGDGFARASKIMFGKKTFHLSKETFSTSYIGIACQMGSPVQNPLSQVLLRMDETGVQRRLKNNEMRGLPVLPSAKETEQRNFAFTIKHLQAAFYIYILGMTVAYMGLLAEVFYCDKTKILMFKHR